MGICQPHNLAQPSPGASRPFGVRVSLRRGDPFRKLLGEAWGRTHWFASATERDAALADMSRRHEYSRSGDSPALVFEKVENLAPRAA
jgi:hypothetical protein